MILTEGDRFDLRRSMIALKCGDPRRGAANVEIYFSRVAKVSRPDWNSVTSVASVAFMALGMGFGIGQNASHVETMTFPVVRSFGFFNSSVEGNVSFWQFFN